MGRAVYNGMISGLGLDGESFFYTNPLCIDTQKNGIEKIYQPFTERQKLFGCSCCPPNLVRMIPSIGSWIYSVDDDILYIHQYIANNAEIDGKEISVITDYPRSGKVTVKANGKKPALRKPAWCDHVIMDCAYEEKDGYLYFETDDVTAEFEMKPKFVRANSNVHSNVGRVAITFGPIVYCAEEIDQNCDLFSLMIDCKNEIKINSEEFGGFRTLTAKGYKVITPDFLYYNASDIKYEKTEIKFIPYPAFANRGESNMQVWMNEKTFND